jgi:hypothetical protein
VLQFDAQTQNRIHSIENVATGCARRDLVCIGSFVARDATMASERAASRRAPPFIDPPGYAQHRPEQTLVYRLVEQHYPAFLGMREATDRPLPGYVQQEFERYLAVVAVCAALSAGDQP